MQPVVRMLQACAVVLLFAVFGVVSSAAGDWNGSIVQNYRSPDSIDTGHQFFPDGCDVSVVPPGTDCDPDLNALDWDASGATYWSINGVPGQTRFLVAFSDDMHEDVVFKVYGDLCVGSCVVTSGSAWSTYIAITIDALEFSGADLLQGPLPTSGFFTVTQL